MSPSTTRTTCACLRVGLAVETDPAPLAGLDDVARVGAAPAVPAVGPAGVAVVTGAGAVAAAPAGAGAADGDGVAALQADIATAIASAPASSRTSKSPATGRR